MDYEVEVICTATSGRLMRKGVAGGAHLIEQVMEEDCKVLTY